MGTKGNLEKGDDFEKYVASLYEALNFHVSRNRNIHGQQVDIVAEKTISGIGKTKVLIECKFLTSGSVSNQIVYDFANFIKTIPHENSTLLSGVIVSNRDFGTATNLAADSVNITLLTQAQLQSEIFQLKDSYLRIVNDYEKSDIFDDYLPLNGTIEHPVSGVRVEVKDVVTAIFEKQDWDVTSSSTCWPTLVPERPL